MASLPATYRELSRSFGRVVRSRTPRRNFHSIRRCQAAQNFAMPAMSPTMTEGNISAWRVKEGDSYSTGDVLLEIETDKAQMEVEAQDDGVMAKIVSPEGSKAVKVGATIAVTAEPGDDISSLEMPKPESAPAPKSEAPKQASEGPKSADPPPSPKETDSKAAPSPRKGPAKPQKYPLYPSVSQLLHEKGLDSSEVDKIPASGPNGRLLKGDVLAHIGAIDAGYPDKQADRISKLEHLDLSSIKIAPRAEPEAAPKTGAPPEPAPVEEPTDIEVAIPISFEAVAGVQQRVRKTLGVEVSIETFIARAINLANADLPASKAPPTADELFDDIVGIGSGRPRSTRGTFLPDVSAAAPESEPVLSGAPGPDVYDVLAGTAPQRAAPELVPVAATAEEAMNVFSVRAPKGDEKRARVFLERMKTALQVEPGSLIM